MKLLFTFSNGYFLNEWSLHKCAALKLTFQFLQVVSSDLDLRSLEQVSLVSSIFFAIISGASLI